MPEVTQKACNCEVSDLQKGLMSVEEAVEVAKGLAKPLVTEQTISIRNACGRVLAKSLYADRSMPFFDNSAMDGYVLRVEDMLGDGPWTFPVLGTIAAGNIPRPVPAQAGAYRIFTGAPVPSGFDTVVMQENCVANGSMVSVRSRPSHGDNIRYRGEDIAQGELLLVAGTRLEPHHVGLLASNGILNVSVTRPVRIGILSTGDELRRNDKLDGPANIFDANAPMLMALCESSMTDVTDLGILPDNLALMTDKLCEISCLYDLIISTGAASLGARDLLREALGVANGEIVAHRVALKPGKPVFFGKLGASLYTGLPGNPLAVFVGFEIFVRAQIDILSGANPRRTTKVRAILRHPIKRKSGRTEFLPARIVGYDEGLPVIEILGHGSSGTLFPLAQADGMVVLSSEVGHTNAGDTFSWFPLSTTSKALGASFYDQ
ncbi:molybdopterin molybdotransferase [Cohaesibacter marisflavi]|uniref:Molybdopterin molybdenumtransferase n=1 Tax=Cohaesibacter marisflavi TaxID=655353 RepID=A0A1I5MAX1_9HYPH|nr:gephyrin-like molybdotransferase Glp [Cohaesibacter marisflavi]SFP06633.1 molybdopterin molybdotransferase [Cohaesibacter marisflavi]